MAKVYLDTDTDTVYVARGNSDFVVISPDGDPTIIFNLPGAASELVNPDDIDTTGLYDEAYDEGYDSGYADGEGAGYSSDDLDDEYQRGYDDGYEAGKAEDDEDAE